MMIVSGFRGSVRTGAYAAVAFVGVVISSGGAYAAGSPASAVESLACSRLSLRGIEIHFGIPSDQWNSDAESALSKRIDDCFPAEMQGMPNANAALQAKRKSFGQLQASSKQNNTQKTSMLNDEQVATIIGEQLFVKKYCPMIVPNQKLFDSFYQPPGQVLFIDPKKMTNADRQKGAETLRMFETHTNTGMIIMSPLDIEYKCKQMLPMFTSDPGFYTYVPQ